MMLLLVSGETLTLTKLEGVVEVPATLTTPLRLRDTGPETLKAVAPLHPHSFSAVEFAPQASM
jgi:hypothetical protein